MHPPQLAEELMPVSRSNCCPHFRQIQLEHWQNWAISFSTLSTKAEIRKTYAAVAANISILLACVANARANEKMSVNTHTIPSRILMLLTKYKTMIEAMGAIDETTVPMILIVAGMCLSE
jgi:hypothetical protein